MVWYNLVKKANRKMKKSSLKRIGRIGKINISANRKLKIIFSGTKYCEIKLPGCLGNWLLQFCHRHKRIWYYTKPELLSDRNQVVIGCQNCHEKIENDKKLTEEVFHLLRKT